MTHENLLADHYPGINLQRFLLEARDLGRKRLKLTLLELEDADIVLPGEILLKMQSDFLNGVPFQYLLQESEFYHHKYFINNSVLIPRHETEYLVHLIVSEFKGKVRRILDVGTGSGVILLGLLAHGVGREGTGVDISEDALEVAKINTKALGLEAQVTLKKSDRLQNVEGYFDLIVSNPPYIKALSHRALVHDSVHKYEPKEALYLPDDFYIQWFEDFFQEIRSHLKGTFFMEGHEHELENQARMMERLGFSEIKVMKDLSGTNRYLRAVIS
jgi:release factor glutamine methyltransferase